MQHTSFSNPMGVPPDYYLQYEQSKGNYYLQYSTTSSSPNHNQPQRLTASEASEFKPSPIYLTNGVRNVSSKDIKDIVSEKIAPCSLMLMNSDDPYQVIHFTINSSHWTQHKTFTLIKYPDEKNVRYISIGEKEIAFPTLQSPFSDYPAQSNSIKKDPILNLECYVMPIEQRRPLNYRDRYVSFEDGQVQSPTNQPNTSSENEKFFLSSISSQATIIGSLQQVNSSLTFQEILRLNQSKGWNLPILSVNSSKDDLNHISSPYFFFRKSSQGNDKIVAVARYPNMKEAEKTLLDIDRLTNEDVILSQIHPETGKKDITSLRTLAQQFKDKGYTFIFSID